MRVNKPEAKVAVATLLLLGYVFALSTATQVMSAVQTNTNISNAGSITAVGLGIYSDSDLTNQISSISWGTLDPGSNVNRTVYIRNQGNAPVTLALTTLNWNPATASNYLTVTWNYGGQTIDVDAAIPVQFTLSAQSSTTGITTFSFDMTITAISQ